MQIAVALAAWCQLRRGEVLGLRRCDIDLSSDTLTVALTRGTGTKGTTIIKEPKSDAGRRVLLIPPSLLPMLSYHLATFVEAESDAPVLTGERCGPLRPRVLQGKWSTARAEVDRPDLHFHDLRHSGLTWTAAAGTTTAELMHRGGHKSNVAALRYQHVTTAWERDIAEALPTLTNVAEIIPIGTRDNRAMGDTGKNSNAAQ